MNYRPYGRKSTDSRRRTSQVSSFGRITMDPRLDIKAETVGFPYVEGNKPDEMKLSSDPGRKEIR